MSPPIDVELNADRTHGRALGHGAFRSIDVCGFERRRQNSGARVIFKPSSSSEKLIWQLRREFSWT